MVRDKVGAGGYVSTSEVVRTALRRWFEDEKRLKALDDAIARGMADAEAGRVCSTDHVRARLQERLE